MTEKSLEQDQQVQIIMERLIALERIHKESPNIQTSIQQIKENKPQLEKKLHSEASEIEEAKQTLIKAIHEIQESIKSLKPVDEWKL